MYSNIAPDSRALLGSIFRALFRVNKSQLNRHPRFLLGKTALRLLLGFFPHLNLLRSRLSEAADPTAAHPAAAEPGEVAEAFMSRECRFWSLLEPSLFLKGPASIGDSEERVLFWTDFRVVIQFAPEYTRKG